MHACVRADLLSCQPVRVCGRLSAVVPNWCPLKGARNFQRARGPGSEHGGACAVGVRCLLFGISHVYHMGAAWCHYCCPMTTRTSRVRFLKRTSSRRRSSGGVPSWQTTFCSPARLSRVFLCPLSGYCCCHRRTAPPGRWSRGSRSERARVCDEEFCTHLSLLFACRTCVGGGMAIHVYS